MKFLSNKEILTQVRRLCAKKLPLQIAVSYWGAGTLEESGLLERIEENPKSVQVICDFWSLACNPEPIHRMIKSGVHVKTLKNFHAKVWICGSDVLVGSANVSFGGLGIDVNESIRSNVEAAVRTRSTDFAKTVRRWFETQWEKDDCVSIGINDTKIAKRLRSERKDSRDLRRVRSTTLLQRLTNNEPPYELRNVHVIVWEESGETTSEKAVAFIKGLARKYFSESEWGQHSEELRWFYDCPNDSDWKFQKGNIYLDFTIPYQRGLSDLKFNGIFRIVFGDFVPIGKSNLALYYKDINCEGFYFPPKEQELLRKRIVECVNKNGLIQSAGENILDMQLTKFWKGNSQK